VLKRSEQASVAAEHRTVTRIVGIIELVAAAEPDGLKLGDLVGPIGAPKSSVHGLTKGLVAVGYLREQGGRYFTGPGVANILGGRLPTFPAAYHDGLRTLVDQWQETAFLSTLVGDSSVYVDRVESPHVIRAAPPTHVRISLWPRSTGKCFLAWMPPRQAETILRRGASDASEMEQMKRDLDGIRAAGYALNDAESEPDMIGIACPILSPRGGEVTLAIAIGGPETRMRPRLDDMIASVRQTAASLAAWA
jgi:DNA-binding IclR family transcriptional regulator